MPQGCAPVIGLIRMAGRRIHGEEITECDAQDADPGHADGAHHEVFMIGKDFHNHRLPGFKSIAFFKACHAGFGQLPGIGCDDIDFITIQTQYQFRNAVPLWRFGKTQIDKVFAESIQQAHHVQGFRIEAVTLIGNTDMFNTSLNPVQAQIILAQFQVGIPVLRLNRNCLFIKFTGFFIETGDRGKIPGNGIGITIVRRFFQRRIDKLLYFIPAAVDKSQGGFQCIKLHGRQLIAFGQVPGIFQQIDSLVELVTFHARGDGHDQSPQAGAWRRGNMGLHGFQVGIDFFGVVAGA